MQAGVAVGRREALLWASAIWLILLFAVAAGLKKWTLSYQAWDLWHLWQDEGYTPVSAFLAWDPHALRFAVYLPIFLVGQWGGLHADTIFTLVSVLATLGLIWAVVDSDRCFSERPSRWRACAYALVIVLLSFMIDGRITLLLAGYSAIVWAALRFVACDRWGVPQLVALFGGTLFCSLSSGTLAVAAAFAGLLGLWTIAHRGGRGAAKPFLLSLPAFFLLYGSCVLAGVVLNLTYFKYDLVALLHHGAGIVAVRLGPLGLTAMGVAALVGLWVVWWLYRKQLPATFVLTMAVVPAAVGGLFGLTTLSIGLVPVLLAIRPSLLSELVRS